MNKLAQKFKKFKKHIDFFNIFLYHISRKKFKLIDKYLLKRMGAFLWEK